MHFNTQLLKRKLDVDDQVEQDARMKRHNHLSTPPPLNTNFVMPPAQSSPLYSAPSSTPNTPLSTNTLDSDSMLIDEIPLYINPSVIDAFDPNPNQFHHHSREILPTFMTGRNAASAGIKIIRMTGLGGYMT